MTERRIASNEEIDRVTGALTENDEPGRRARIVQMVLVAAAGTAFLQIVSGFFSAGAAGSRACPDWPLCFGQFAFPEQPAAGIQTLHRFLAALTFILTAAGWGFVYAWFKQAGNVRKLIITAGSLLILESLVGAVEVLAQPSSRLAPLHLALALAVLATLLAAAARINLADWREGVIPFMRLTAPFARLAWITLGAIFALMVSAVWLAGFENPQVCAGWPFCSGGWSTPAALLQSGHRLLGGLAGVLAAVSFTLAWRRHNHNLAVLTGASMVLVLFAGQGLIGALQVSRNFPPELMLLHAINSAAVFAVQALVVIAAAREVEPASDLAPAVGMEAEERGGLTDFLRLSKPLIVLLLLFTTFTGMVVAAGGLPGWQALVWTMLGGGLSAAGASAINQYIDRELDRFMERTASRPLPEGRLTPAEGLAFGAMACLAGFYILACFVNLPAALLSLAGMIYYVIVYSWWLKPRSVQNVVIGGGAGAIPTLVGWAAASGGLEWRALGLALIVFLWSPPHFWALALVRRKDYARVGIPMLPVVFGERFTRRQIFLHTLVLVTFTWLLPLMHVGGFIYFACAFLAGAGLVYFAVRVLSDRGNEYSWILYRYSSIYLAVLFFGLIIDILISKTP